jgi:hypothetical protein
MMHSIGHLLLKSILTIILNLGRYPQSILASRASLITIVLSWLIGQIVEGTEKAR